MAQNAVIDPSSLPSRKLDLVVLGDLGVGKSSIVLRFITSTYVTDYDADLTDSWVKQFHVDRFPYTLHILDLSMTDEVYWTEPFRIASGFCLVYSPSSLSSFANLNHYLERIKNRETSFKEHPIVLVESKSDLELSERQVSKEEGHELARLLNCPFIQCSAKNDANITELFETITREAVRLIPAPTNASNRSRGLKNCIVS